MTETPERSRRGRSLVRTGCALLLVSLVSLAAVALTILLYPR